MNTSWIRFSEKLNDESFYKIEYFTEAGDFFSTPKFQNVIYD